MKNVLFLLLCGLLVFSASCGDSKSPKRIPPEKSSFVGVWQTTSGFELEILNEGRANLRQITNESDPDWDRLNIKVGPPIIKNLQVRFIGDNTLEVIEPHLYARDYHIDRPPYEENGQSKMMLNGVMFIKD